MYHIQFVSEDSNMNQLITIYNQLTIDMKRQLANYEQLEDTMNAGCEWMLNPMDAYKYLEISGVSVYKNTASDIHIREVQDYIAAKNDVSLSTMKDCVTQGLLKLTSIVFQTAGWYCCNKAYYTEIDWMIRQLNQFDMPVNSLVILATTSAGTPV